MPDDLTDENFSLFANSDVPCDEVCFMALESILEGQESDEVAPSAETVGKVAEAVVTAVVGEQLLEKKESEPLLEPLADPWDGRVCEDECDYAMMAAAKISPQVLKNPCSDKCIIGFANIKEVNENHRDTILKDEAQFEKKNYQRVEKQIV
ncbi:hypothetical protein Hanom_Chr06g00521911 [Helianthus anomalus]